MVRHDAGHLFQVLNPEYCVFGLRIKNLQTGAWHRGGGECRAFEGGLLALQLHFIASSESMGNHDPGSDKWRRIC